MRRILKLNNIRITLAERIDRKLRPYKWDIVKNGNILGTGIGGADEIYHDIKMVKVSLPKEKGKKGGAGV